MQLDTRVPSRGREVHVLSNMASGLCYCHNRDVVHRDVKPENFMFASGAAESDVKLIDFGISRTLKPGQQYRRPPRSPAGLLGRASPHAVQVASNCARQEFPSNPHAVPLQS